METQYTPQQVWEELPEQLRNDLVEWYNVRPDDMDANDRGRLAALYSNGLFHAWDCPMCGERVRVGEPEDWGHFQGVNGADFMSYLGFPEIYTAEIIARQCDQCRCHPPSPSVNPEREEY